jgi:hypothetical protein
MTAAGTFYLDTSTYLTSAITSLNGLTGATQTFVNDTNVTMVSTGTTHTITWSGTLANDRLATMANNTIKGNVSGITASPSNLTGTQVTAILDIFNGSRIGLVPVPSGPGTNVFLAADGTWQKIATSGIADQSGKTLIANTSPSLGAVSAVAISSITTELNVVVGDSGSGGTKGLVPNPGAGDASAGKFLKADGTWAVPAGGGGGTTTNPFIIKADSGTTEGTDLYTFNGSSAKTINIVAGTNITITKTSGTLTVSSTAGSTPSSYNYIMSTHFS